MQAEDIKKLFTDEVLQELLPPNLSDDFFEALYGDADEGAYDIHLAFESYDPDKAVLAFDLRLTERPGKCLQCNLTFGLPEVFSRHPLINIGGMVEKIVDMLGEGFQSSGWKLGSTKTPGSNLHVIPLTITLAE